MRRGFISIAATNEGAEQVTEQRFERNTNPTQIPRDRELKREEMAISVPRTSWHANDTSKRAPSRDAINLVVVPARKDGFRRVFLGQNEWYAIRIADDLLPQLKYIAAYQSAPVSAITHYAEIDRIEPYGKAGLNRTYRVIFAGPANEITPIPYASSSHRSV